MTFVRCLNFYEFIYNTFEVIRSISYGGISPDYCTATEVTMRGVFILTIFNEGAYLSIFHKALNLFKFDCEIESVPGTNQY